MIMHSLCETFREIEHNATDTPKATRCNKTQECRLDQLPGYGSSLVPNAQHVACQEFDEALNLRTWSA